MHEISECRPCNVPPKHHIRTHRLAVDHFLALSEEDKRGDNPAPESMSAWMQKKGMCELLDVAKLPARLTEARMRALAAVGEYVECFGQALSCGAVELGLAIAHGPGDAGWSSEAAHARALEKPARTSASSKRGLPQLPESLAALCALLKHRKFANIFVDRGGVRALLCLPRGPLTYDGFAQCLFGVSQVTSAMERLLAPPARGGAGGVGVGVGVGSGGGGGSHLARRCVDAALEAINGGHDDARKHAAMFLTLSFPFPAIIDAFDAAGGLRNVLNLLRHTATLGGGASARAGKQDAFCCTTTSPVATSGRRLMSDLPFGLKTSRSGTSSSQW